MIKKLDNPRIKERFKKTIEEAREVSGYSQYVVGILKDYDYVMAWAHVPFLLAIHQ